MDLNENREDRKKQRYVSEVRKENERKETIKETLKTSIKLKAKLKDQSKIISSEDNIDETFVLAQLKQYMTNS